jgi:eukaryotic-like serine/threonine-protein kinase
VPNCPTCGAAAEAGQEYCLECGARLPSGPTIISTVGRAWSRRLRWYPGDWLPLVLALLVVAALATAAAVYAARDEEEAAPGRTLVATAAPDVTDTEASTVPTETAPVASVPTRATRTATQPTDGAGAGSPVEWPADQDGFTVVLASMPVSGGRAVALRNARSAIRSGLKEVGVLDSQAFASLHPGFYVVFAGIYASLEEAENAVSDARDAGFGNAYAREITG